MVIISASSWEAVLRMLLPQASAMHICWMFRLHGVARFVDLAEWLYHVTFDFCVRDASNTPATAQRSICIESNKVKFLRRVPSDIGHDCSVDRLKVITSNNCEQVNNYSKKDWENPEVVGRRRRCAHP